MLLHMLPMLHMLRRSEPIWRSLSFSVVTGKKELFHILNQLGRKVSCKKWAFWPLQAYWMRQWLEYPSKNVGGHLKEQAFHAITINPKSNDTKINYWP